MRFCSLAVAFFIVMDVVLLFAACLNGKKFAKIYGTNLYGTKYHFVQKIENTILYKANRVLALTTDQMPPSATNLPHNCPKLQQIIIVVTKNYDIFIKNAFVKDVKDTFVQTDQCIANWQPVTQPT